MKTVNILLLTLLSLGLSNCSYQPYYNDQTSLLTDIPTYRHTNEVDVFYMDEYISEDFLPIHEIYSKKTGENSYEKIIIDLKQQAQKLGLDAVIIEEHKDGYRTEEKKPSTLGIILGFLLGFEPVTTYEDIYYQEFKAVGIKYRKNIDYLDQYVYSKTIWQEKTDGRKQVASAYLNLFGRIMKTEGDSIQWNNYYQCTLEHLAFEYQKPWKWKNISNSDQKKWRRKYDLSDRYLKVDVHFKDFNQIDFLKIKKKRTQGRSTSVSEEHMAVIYQKGNKDIKRTELYRDEKLIRSEEYFYDQEGRILQRQVFLFKEKKKILDKTIVYEYYRNSDIDYFFPNSAPNQE